jgi:hypothetical protein
VDAEMKTLFAVNWGIESASTRFRAAWPAKHMPGAALINARELVEHPEQHSADNYIFIKIGEPGLWRKLKATGARVFWDLCDPVWWWEPQSCRELAELADGVVCSSSALAAEFRDWCSEFDSLGEIPFVVTIPDRLDLDHYPKKRTHLDTRPVRLIWFGAGQNRIALFAALANLERLVSNGHEITLTICDDHPEQEWPVSDRVQMYYTRWNLERENEIIAGHDIALLPPYPGPWGRVKSNNKMLTAWACGLPTTDGQDYEYLEELVTMWELRMVVADAKLEEINDMDVRKSAREWENLLCSPAGTTEADE